MSWFSNKVDEYSQLSGYVKPDLHDGALKLDSNENFVVSESFQADIIGSAQKNSDVRQYPLGGTDRLIQELSGFLKVPSDMIGVGNGSDQILDLILSCFALRKKVLTTDPTFGFFEERCKLYSIPMIRVPFLDNMTLDVQKLAEQTKGADILYLDMPNNPTGFALPKSDLKKLVEEFSGLVIIDEAYGEFGDYSAVQWTKKMQNLIVVGTFSKSLGLAGMRLGYFVADSKFADVFNRVIQYPYPLSSLSIEAGIAALQNSPQALESVDIIKKERQRVIEGLQQHDAFEVFDSKANFVLFDAGGADTRIYTALAEQGILIRKLGKIGQHQGCLRVSIGTKEMNSRFLLAVRDLLG